MSPRVSGGAAVLKVPTFSAPENKPIVGPALEGAICAALATYLSVRFLPEYFETKRLTLLAVTCTVAGFVVSAAFLQRDEPLSRKR